MTPNEETLRARIAFLKRRLEAAEAENERLREAVEDALGRRQVTHIHAVLRAALASPTPGEDG